MRHKDLQREREDTRNLLERTTEEICLLKEQLRIAQKDIIEKEDELVKMRNTISNYEAKNMVDNEKEKKVGEELSQSMKLLDSKESEVIKLNELLSKEKESLKEK